MRKSNFLPHIFRLAQTTFMILLFTSLTFAQRGNDGCDDLREKLQNVAPSDQKAGSVLFYAKFTSDTTDPLREDTQINITNIHQREDVDVHFYFVDGSTCAVADGQITLTANQTARFFASDLDPGVVGYLIAVANFSGVPTQFNNLIGDAYIQQIDGTTAMLPAMAVIKNSAGDLPVSLENRAVLKFDGNDYERLPQSVAVSTFNSQVTHSTTLSIFVPTTSLLGNGNNATNVFVLLYDDTERVRSTNFILRCYRQMPLIDLRVAEGLNNFVKSGHTGWIRLSTQGDVPILGASLTRGPRFNGGLNFKTLALLKSYSITLPVI